MKKTIILSPFLASVFFLSISFYSCQSDPVSIIPSQNVAWQMVDSTTIQYAEGIYMSDANTAYVYSASNTYKVSGTSVSIFDFGEAGFHCTAIDSYTPSYTVFAGESYPKFAARVKILDGGTITSVLLDSINYTSINGIKIIQPGKFLIAANGKLYLYDNGAVTITPLHENEYTFEIAKNGNTIYLGTHDNDYQSRVYKFENNILTELSSEFSSQIRMHTDNYIMKNLNSDLLNYVAYFDGSTWKPLFSDNRKLRFFKASGENFNNVYFTSYDTINYTVRAAYWNGTTLSDDVNYPFFAQELGSYLLDMSNMREKTFYVAKTGTGKCYLYRGKIN